MTTNPKWAMTSHALFSGKLSIFRCSAQEVLWSRILNTSSLIINKTPLVISNHTTGNVQKAAVIVRQFFVFSFIFKNLSSVLFDILIDLRSDSVIKGVRGIFSSFLALWRRASSRLLETWKKFQFLWECVKFRTLQWFCGAFY